MEAALLQLIITILFSIGVSFTAGSIGMTLEDAYNSGNLDFSKVPEGIQSDFENFLHDYDVLSQSEITEEDIIAAQKQTIDVGAYVGVNNVLNEIGLGNWISSNSDSVVTEIIRDLDHIKFVTSSGKYLVITASEPYAWSESVSGKAIDLNYELYYPDGTKIPYSESHNNLGWLNGQWVGTRWISSDSLSKVLSTLDISEDGVLTFQYDSNIRGRTERMTVFWPEYYGNSSIDITESAVDIGTAVVDGAEKALNPDGSITLSDGTVLYMNPDGTYTLPDSSVVTPTINLNAYDDTALMGLLQQLISRINDLEYQLTFEKDTALDLSVDVAYDGVLSEFMLNSAIMQVFPFCLPADFYRGVKLFSATPATPHFTYKIKIPAIGLFEGTEIVIDIDLSPFEDLAFICRWLSTFAFAFSLIFVSTKIVKGAGA